MKLKPIKQQTIVITGATSGIGLVTARLAAKKGARVVVAARNEEALTSLETELKDSGAQAVAVVADVASEGDVAKVSAAAINAFGGIDTWVNNAGVSVYGKLEKVPLEDMRRVIETNFWGVVNGSLEAVKHLRQSGGALINVGSVLSDRAIPLQGIYCASKHAVKGFTDALRMELEQEKAPISVTLVKPSAIDTPYTKHAKNYMDSEPKNPAPVYAPDIVARAILHCAHHPERDIIIGGGGLAMSAMGQTAPRMTDRYMRATMFKGQQSGKPKVRRADSLHAPSQDGEERGEYDGHVSEMSVYTTAKMHPVLTGAALLAGALAVTGVVLAVTGNLEPIRRSRWARLPSYLRPRRWWDAAHDAIDELDVPGHLAALRERGEHLRDAVM